MWSEPLARSKLLGRLGAYKALLLDWRLQSASPCPAEMKTMPLHEKVDRDGTPLRVGDIVRVIGVPDLTGMSQECRAETEPVFECLKNKYKKIDAFDEYGCAEIRFRILTDKQHVGHHTVWIEPFLLRKKAGRT